MDNEQGGRNNDHDNYQPPEITIALAGQLEQPPGTGIKRGDNPGRQENAPVGMGFRFGNNPFVVYVAIRDLDNLTACC